jgi:hypothetical protein
MYVLQGFFYGIQLKLSSKKRLKNKSYCIVFQSFMMCFCFCADVNLHT